MSPPLSARMDEGINWTCRCGARTFRHLEWCGHCGSARPPPPPPKEPSHQPSIKDGHSFGGIICPADNYSADQMSAKGSGGPIRKAASRTASTSCLPKPPPPEQMKVGGHGQSLGSLNALRLRQETRDGGSWS